MNLFQSSKNFILDTLFPISCLSCGRGDDWLCNECLKNIELLSFQKCPICEKVITENGQTCPPCKPKSHLDTLLVATNYKDSSISKIIHLYKYRFIEDLSFPLGKILSKAFLQSNLPIPDFIIPIPLHPRRMRWRGFNQSQKLAECISENMAPGLKITICNDVLQRARFTSPQMRIKNYNQRLENLRNAFIINENEQALPQNVLHNKTVLLLDDVATTGATLFECAKTLKRYGVKKVSAIVVARQEINN